MELVFSNWYGKRVMWKHPFSTKEFVGTITGLRNGFLLVKDSVGTEGIKHEWITHTFGA